MSMIKVSRQLMERLTLIAHYMGRNGMDSPYSVIRDAYENAPKRIARELGQVFPEINRSGFSVIRDLGYEDLVEEAIEYLQGDAASGGDGHFPKLISTIVDLLQVPHGREVMAGDTLKRLRKAVLFPEELAKVTENAAKELHCSSCGHLFADGEMATQMGGGFQCSVCTLPCFVACAKGQCDGFFEIDRRSISKLTSKAFCHEHNGKQPVEPIPPEVRAVRANLPHFVVENMGQPQAPDPHPFGDAPPNLEAAARRMQPVRWGLADEDAPNMAIPRDPRRRAGR